MNGLIHELTTELRNDPKFKDSAVVRVVLESINNSVLLGAPSDQILESALTNLEELANATVNENLKEVVSKFRKLAEKPTQRLQNMAKEAGISMKLKALKESAIASDPIFANNLANIEKFVQVVPEFRTLGLVFESLNKFAYDPAVSKVLEDLTKYVNENRSKLEVLNAIFEMRQASSIIYKDAIDILEECLLTETLSSDTIKMKMRGKVEMPIVNRLVNTLSMVEAKQAGKFNIGLGNGEAKVFSVIAPFQKISESSVIALLDSGFVKLSEDDDPISITLEEAKAYPEFFELCEAYATLNFAPRENEVFSRGRRLEVSFAINEAGNLQLKINGKVVDDLTKVDLTKMFMMESVEVRSKLVTLFNHLDSIVNLEFAKRLVNERMNKDSYVFTIGETQYVFERLGNTRIVKKMQGLAFHNYVMENFHYDVSELYSIQLNEREELMKHIDEEKNQVNRDLEKLERSVNQLEEALADDSLSNDYRVQLVDLKESIQKNIVALKNHYIDLDQSKKKA